MTKLLKHAVAEAERLPEQDQDAIATRLLAEIEDERQWSARFAATTDEQWDRMAEQVRREIAAGNVVSLDEALPAEESAT